MRNSIPGHAQTLCPLTVTLISAPAHCSSPLIPTQISPGQLTNLPLSFGIHQEQIFLVLYPFRDDLSIKVNNLWNNNPNLGGEPYLHFGCLSPRGTQLLS